MIPTQPLECVPERVLKRLLWAYNEASFVIQSGGTVRPLLYSFPLLERAAPSAILAVGTMLGVSRDHLDFLIRSTIALEGSCVVLTSEAQLESIHMVRFDLYTAARHMWAFAVIDQPGRELGDLQIALST